MTTLSVKTVLAALCSCHCVRQKPPALAMAEYNPPTIRYTCDICGQEDLTEEDMRSHVLLEHIEGAVSCPFCDLEGTTAEEMHIHVNMEHLEFLGNSDPAVKPAVEDLTPGSAYSDVSSQRLSQNGQDAAASSPDNKDCQDIVANCPTDNEQTDITINVTSPQGSPSKSPARSSPGTPEPEQNCKRAKLYLDVSHLAAPAAHLCTNVNQQNNNVCLLSPQKPATSPGGCSIESYGCSGGGSVLYDCPLCSWKTTSPGEITRHVNAQHLDVLSPNKARTETDSENNVIENSSGTSFECPICGCTMANARLLESHVNREHSDILSPGKALASPMSTDSPSEGNCCPLCAMQFSSTKELLAHVDGHFSADHTPVLETTDSQIALELERTEREALKEQEQKEFEKLQEMYGMSSHGSYKKQAEKNLEEAVCNGQMSVSDYYTYKQQVLQSSTAGVDDGHSCTKGIIGGLKQYYKTCVTSTSVVCAWLCSYCDHYSASYGDKGWGCGYRNLQMLLSALANNTTYQHVLFNGRPVIPSIPKIQRLIEVAWQKGFDLQGCDQLGGSLVNTTKWIGATEIVSMLSSLKIKCRLIDFHAPTKDGFHPHLFEWVRDYFNRPSDYKPPLYLQHQGHSRTIIGVEELKDGSLRLLLFDPSSSRKQMRQFQGDISANLMRCLRRTQNSMKAKQYQIVAAVGVLTDQEYEESKVLKSERIP